MSALAKLPAVNPAQIGYPPTLPLEVALAAVPIKEICRSYGISREQWADLRLDHTFQNAVSGYLDELKKDGMSFKLKARLQAEGMLEQNWNLVHDKSGLVPASVKADLIKFTVRCAGLSEEKQGQGPGSGGIGTALQINIMLDDK